MAWNLGLLGASQFPVGSYDLIQTTTVSSATPSVTINNIDTLAASYLHLQLRLVTRSTKTSTQSHLVTINSDTSANYARHTLEGNGTSVLSNGTAPSNFMTISGSLPGTDSEANSFEACVMTVSEPFNTSKYSTFRFSHGLTNNVVSNIRLSSGLWVNTDAINSITFSTQVDNYDVGSSFSLYGIRA